MTCKFSWIFRQQFARQWYVGGGSCPAGWLSRPRSEDYQLSSALIITKPFVFLHQSKAKQITLAVVDKADTIIFSW